MDIYPNFTIVYYFLLFICIIFELVEDIFDTTKTFFFILPELSFTFAVNFFKGEIYFQKQLLILFNMVS